ncbi:MAG TPA: sulfatase [Gemmatimonadaceae bacterium]|nr:sulfatase [Gemmatimonadaceae bacterium]
MSEVRDAGRHAGYEPPASAAPMPRRSPEAAGAAEAGARVPLVALVAWFAIVTGLIDAGILLFQRFALGRITGQSPDGIWMAPLAYCALFALPALAIAAATARASERSAFAWRVGALAFLSWGSILLFLYMRLHKAALVALAIGLAVQTARIGLAHRGGFARLVRRTVPALAALVALLAAALPGGRWLAERRALAAVPAPPAGAVNVLLIILDTVRAHSLGLHGGARANTPELERLAREGVMFERAITAAPWTLASHASMFTGHPVHDLGVGWERSLDGRYPTLAEVLRDRGYLTAGITANFYYTTWESGLQRGFVHYDAQPVTARQALKSTALGQLLEHVVLGLTLEERTSDRRTAEEINRDFLRWLRDAGDHPFFAFINYIDAHLPYEPPEPFRSRFHADSSDVHAYEASIAYADQQVGALVDSLARLGVLRNTLVIVTSDHGELLGEHGLHGHTRGMYLPLLHVPLVMMLSERLPAGARVPGVASLADLPATVLDIVQPGAADALPGRSLAARWRAGAAAGDTVLSEYSVGGVKSLFDGRLHYVQYPNGREELYDVTTDPEETRDLAAVSRPEMLDGLRARMRAVRAAARAGQ